MAPTLKLLSLALLSSMGSAAIRPGRLTNGVDEPDVTNSPDEIDNPTVTISQEPAITSVFTDGGDVITSIDYRGTPAGTVSRSGVFGGTTLSGFTTYGTPGSGFTSYGMPGITARPSRPSQTSCPTDQSSYFFSQRNFCCPGDFYGRGFDALCGISCTRGSTGPTAIVPSDLSCSSSIMVTDDNYDSKVAAATSQAGSEDSASTTASPGTAAMITAGPMMGVFAVAGGMLLAA